MDKTPTQPTVYQKLAKVGNSIRPDAEFLASRFSLSELGHELHAVDVNALPNQNGYAYWTWYSLAVSIAINLLRARQPKPTTRRGYVNIENVKSLADIVALAEDYGLLLLKMGHYFKTRCPFLMIKPHRGSCTRQRSDFTVLVARLMGMPSHL